MKRFIYALLCIIAMWWCFDRVGGLCMWWLNQHSQDTTSPKIKHIVEGISEDVILMGTSRCNGHYVPKIIQDTLGLSVYNAGVDGSDNIFAQYIVLSHILKHHTPRIVVLEVGNSFLSEEESAYMTTGYFAPYFGLNEKADSVYHMSGDYWLYRLSHLYRYNTKVLANITGQIRHCWDNAEQGYNPNPKPLHFPNLSRWQTEDFEINDEKKDYMCRFIRSCHERGVFLCFSISPSYSLVDSDYYTILKGMASAYNVPVLDYHTSGLYLNHPEYFKDASHLWDKGAKLYSSVFASDLKRLLNP